MNDAFILVLAYPETIVSHAEEWYSPWLKYIGIGNKTHVRAGHAALVLIKKCTGVLEYYDFGRYITASPNGRVRGKQTDFELDFTLKAEIEGYRIKNLDAILKFLATHPKLTHGDGNLYVSICRNINYQKARHHITQLQDQGFIRYAAFINNACNCARFVTDTLIASVTDLKIRKYLLRSTWFTPSTISNVVLANTEKHVFKITSAGDIGYFKSSVGKVNRTLFLDRLKNYEPSLEGTLLPKQNHQKKCHAQWLGGIAAGAWFELYDLGQKYNYRFRRISPNGNVDCDGVYRTNLNGFNINFDYHFEHYSNCAFFHVRQYGKLFKFEFVETFTS